MVMKDGKFSTKRGATLPLSVLPDIDSEQLRTKAVEKHARFNNNLINSATMYSLLYPGCKQVLNLPGSSEPFSLKKYKQELDKPYSRITFYLCSSEHFIESLLEDDSDDDEIIRCTSTIVNDTLTQSEDLALVTPGPQTADENRLDVQSTSSEIFTGNSAISTPTTSKRLSMVKCPICFNQYSLEDIERHADSCSMWLIEDDQLPADEFEPETESSGCLSCSEEDNASQVLSKASMKESIKNKISHVVAIEMSHEEPKRLTIRRKFLWQDFTSARLKNIDPKRKIKVIFAGEPAVDDGGPRRELFSGK